MKDKKRFPKAHITQIPKWFEDRYAETQKYCSLAERFPIILVYRAFLLGQRSVADPN